MDGRACGRIGGRTGGRKRRNAGGRSGGRAGELGSDKFGNTVRNSDEIKILLFLKISGR